MLSVLIATLLTGMALPQDAPAKALGDPDFQCFSGSIALAGISEEKKDTTAVEAATMVAFYFLGRLEGRHPEVNWFQQLIEIPDDQVDGLLSEMVRCSEEFGAKGEEMLAMGKSAK